MISKLLASGRQQLESAGFPADEADILLAATLQHDRAYLYSHGDEQITEIQQTHFLNFLQQRLQGQPLAYILQQKEFYGRSFTVTSSVLVPRPESELLIDLALSYLRDKKQATIIDIGTGSGCLIITVALETQQKFNYYAGDISAEALAVAEKNAAMLGAQITFVTSDLLGSVPPQKFDLIIANLPYLTAEQMDEPSIQAEPALALEGGKEGLHYYRQLLQQLPDYLAESAMVLLEIDPQQKDLLEVEIKKQFPNGQVEFVKDLSDRVRVVKISVR